MNRVVVNGYSEENLYVSNDNVMLYSSGDGEVLSGGGPPLITRYLDMSVVGSGHAGSEVDPWSVTDWQSAIRTYQGHVIYVKGVVDDNTGEVILNGDSSGSIVQFYTPWDAGVNGPYRMRLSAYGTGTSFIRNGILFLDGDGSRVSIMNNKIMGSGSYIRCGEFQSQLNGCLLDCTTFTAAGDCIDLVVKADVFTDNEFNTFSNCAFSGTFTATNKINCQDNVNVLVPAFDAVKASFSVSVMFSGINTPPQPGNPPYVETVILNGLPGYYDKGLWGEDRVGIGAGFFGIVPMAFDVGYPVINSVTNYLGKWFSFQIKLLNVTKTEYYSAIILPEGEVPDLSSKTNFLSHSEAIFAMDSSFVTDDNIINGRNITLSGKSFQDGVSYRMYVVIHTSQTVIDPSSLLGESVVFIASVPEPKQIYFDLGVADGIGLGDGSDVDNYMGLNDLNNIGNIFNLSALGPNDIFYFRGKASTINLTMPENVLMTFDKWPGGDPWKLDGMVNINAPTIKMKNGIFDVSMVGASYFGSLENCFIILGAEANTQITFKDFIKCTVVSEASNTVNFGRPEVQTTNGYVIPVGGIIQDSILAMQAQLRPLINLTISNVKTTKLDEAALFNNVGSFVLDGVDDIVYGVEPYSVPLVDDDVDSFKFDVDLGPEWARLVLDVTAPGWEETYPKVNEVDESSVQFAVRIDEDGDVYCVVVPNDVVAPTAQQVKDGVDSANNVAFSGNIAAVADVESIINITGLQLGTAYDAYFVTEDIELNLQVTPVKLDFYTTDESESEWVETYPKNDLQTINTAVILVSLTEAATVYGVAIPKGSAAPTSIQVKNGQNAGGGNVATGMFKSVVVVANEEFEMMFSNLLINADYDAYFVAEDIAANLQAVVKKVQFTTLPLISGQKTVPQAEVGQILSLSINNLNVTTTKNFPTDFKMAVFPGEGYDIIVMNEKSADVKITRSVDVSRFINVKVGDGIKVSDVYKIKVQIVAGFRPKSKPVSYGVTNITPPDPFTPAFRR